MLLWVAEGAVPHPSTTNATSHREVTAQRDRSGVEDSPNCLHPGSCILQQPDPDPPSHIPVLHTDHRPSSLGSHLVTTLSPVNCHGNHKQITNTELAPSSSRAPCRAALQAWLQPCSSAVLLAGTPVIKGLKTAPDTQKAHGLSKMGSHSCASRDLSKVRTQGCHLYSWTRLKKK